MKITVLGAGAVGSMIGGLLQADAPEFDVTLVGRGQHGDTMQKRKTLIVDDGQSSREIAVNCTSDVSAAAGSQILLLTVKSQDTEAMMQSVRPFVGDAILVSIQNGMNDVVLSAYVPSDRLVMGVTATNVYVSEPGRVSLQLGGATMFGPPRNHGLGAAGKLVAEVCGRIRSESLQFSATSDLPAMQYHKLTINAVGCASCLSASNFISEALCHAAWRTSVGLPLLRECQRLTELARIRMQRIPGTPSLRGLNYLLQGMNAPVVGSLVSFAADQIYNRRPIEFSLLQDLRRRRHTEVDYINGEFVRLGESLREKAPFNRVVASMAGELEARGDGSCFKRDEVIRRFQSLN
jgi:2-dehydropantoate 2-reductase